MIKKFTSTLLLSAVILPYSVMAADSGPNLGDMSIESLGNMVTSVSKKPEDSFRSAAAIYVITNEDIKLSGATHIAEVLRGVPGLDVARVDASNWAISSRGFNALFSNKLLVLVDGRTIYTPMFSGVYWDIQNIPLEDVARVEVIRGPGAALWGANAVDGIINIITKSAADTQGTYASVVSGNQDHLVSDARYGGKIDDDLYYRAYAKYDNRGATIAPTAADGSGSGNNNWENGKAGFRSDWNASPNRKITVQGDAYKANINLDLSIPTLTAATGIDSFHDVIHSEGANMLGRWEEKHSDTLQSTFQGYVDFQSPSYSQFKQHIYTLDVDYQTEWKAGERNEVVWGAGARDIEAYLGGSTTLAVNNEHKAQQIYNAFLQDQIALVPKELYLTLGSKFEQNSLVGFVPEPSARIAWYPDNKQTVWGAVSHAVRTPSIGERSLTLNALSFGPGAVATQQFNPDFESEELTAYEIGYRIKPTQKVSIDSTAFYNHYDKLETFEPGAEIITPDGSYFPFVASNLGKGHSFGFESSVTWDVTSRWNLLGNYSYINMILDPGASQDPTFMSQQGAVPHNQFMLRSQWFLPQDVQLINTAYYTDRLPAQGIKSYVRFDTQVMWQPAKGWEIALVGQNLLESHHAEIGAPLNGTANEIPRAYYARLTLRY